MLLLLVFNIKLFKLKKLGASFIGLESAATIKKELKDTSVIVADAASVPFERVLGK